MVNLICIVIFSIGIGVSIAGFFTTRLRVLWFIAFSVNICTVFLYFIKLLTLIE